MAADLIGELEADETRLVFARFDNDDAWRLGSLMVAAARERSLPITIDIRRGRQRLFHAALAGTSSDNDAWIERKANVVDRFAASSFLVGQRLKASGRSLAEVFGIDPGEYAAHGGSFPIRVHGVGVVGAVTASGLPQAEDHAFVVEMVAGFLAG